MITRKRYLSPRDGNAPDASEQLELLGYAVLSSVFAASEVAALRDEVLRLFAELPPPSHRANNPTPGTRENFRYEMLNHSALCQRVVVDRRILDVIEPLLAEDCHVIANTAWRNLPREEYRTGSRWHVDGGPHIPRLPGIPWDDRIPYPVFAVAAHILLQDCPTHCGPTAVIPGSHRSGQGPSQDEDLNWHGEKPLALTGKAGDVLMFVSDLWHCRLPTSKNDEGRMFLQIHYERRDIAQRLRPTEKVNHASDAAIERAQSPRDRTVLGLHPRHAYDG